jgi:hypothetical protein
MSECLLCRLARGLDRITHLYWEDSVCVVVDCKVHNQPMIVIKRHSPLPSPEEAEHVQELMQKLFLGKAFRGPKSILEHFHWHME